MTDIRPDERPLPAAAGRAAIQLLRTIAGHSTSAPPFPVAVSDARALHEVIHDLQTELTKTKNAFARLLTDSLRAEQRAGLARLEEENSRLVTQLVDMEAKLDKARRAAKSFQQLARRIEAKKGKR